MAALAVFGACVALAPPGRHWLDASEFVAAAHGLGVAHPPGHPVAVLLGKAATLLVPLGSIAFRVTLASALALAAATGVAASLAGRALEASSDLHPREARWWAAACAVGVGWCGPSLLQGVRAEVYALNAFLTLASVAPLVFGPLTPRRCGLSALAAGLGLANHHLLLVAGVAPALVVSLVRRPGLRPGAAVLGGLGLAAYALLPVRALADPVANWGDPRTLGRWVWTVSARVFQRFRGDAAPDSVGSNLVESGFVVMDALGPVGALVAVAGLGLLVRRDPRSGLGLVAAASGVMLTKAVMGFEPNNPDLRGYWLPATLLLAPGAAVFAGAVVDVAAGRVAWRGLVGATALGWAALRLATGGPALPPPEAEDARLAANHALSQAPPHALMSLADFNLAFSVWAAEAVEGARPDVSPAVRAFLDHPGYAAHLARRFPGAAPWVRRARGASCPPAAPPGRPVVTELHHDLSSTCLRGLSPDAVAPAGGALEALSARMHEDDLGSARWVVWQHWLHALHREARGEPRLAARHVAEALRRAPQDAELQGLRARLGVDGEGPPGP